MDPVRLIVYSDYLCPWCHLASHRLHRLEEELGPALELEWRSYLLRPHPRGPQDPGEGRSLQRFVRYTQSWLRPAAEPDAPTFRVWESAEGPPTHSVPPHLVARAAARVSRSAFRQMHQRLLRAYFEESRDISRLPVLGELWRGLGLPPTGLAALDDPEEQRALLEAVLADHREAREISITGVPAVRVAGTEAFVTGAQPLEVYRRWIGRLRDGVLEARSA